jgi:oligopeptide transport system substrate-binding protein
MLSYCVLVSLVLCGCAKKPEGRAQQSSERMLNLSVGCHVMTIDPATGDRFPEGVLVRMLFEGLMRYERDGTLGCATAERYALSEDGKTYTFYLRPTQWTNGADVTAHDFAYAWKKILAPDQPMTGKHNFYPIKNVQASIRGDASLDEIGIRVLDDRTLVVELEHPTPYFLEATTTPCYFPVNAELDRRNPKWSSVLDSTFVCNGPFRLTDGTPGDRVAAVKNDAYWDARSVKLPGINILIVGQPITQLLLFERKELDWIGRPLAPLPSDAIPSLRQAAKLLYRPSFFATWFVLNTEELPFSNKKMRKAFAYALNREQLTQMLLQQQEIPALSLIPPHIAYRPAPYFPDGDVAAARRLFEEALQELGLTREQLPPIVLNSAVSEAHQKLALVVQEQWQAVFGVPIQLKREEWGVHFSTLSKGNYQIGQISWVSLLRDPIYFFETFKYRADALNLARWEHPQYQALLDATNQQISTEERFALLRSAEEILMEDMPIIPVYFSSTTYAKSDALKDVCVNDIGGADFRWAYFEEERR